MARAEVTVQGTKGVQKLLDQLPALLLAKGGPADRAVRAAGNVVAKRQRQIAPVSRKTGTEAKQSKTSREDIWKYEVYRQIRTKVVRYPTASVAITGAAYPRGNAAHFIQEKPRRHVLWGKATAVKRYKVERSFAIQAAEETKSKQLNASKRSLQKDIDKLAGK